MKSTSSQPYLIKNIKKLYYFFYLELDRSLHYKIYSDGNNLIESEKLADNILNFSVAIDKNDKIHLICISSEGNVIYYINQNDKWSNKIISKFDIKSNTYKYLQLYIHDDYKHIFYTKTNLLTPIISTSEHIYWNEDKINRVLIANYIHGKYSSPLQISVDSMRNFHMIYKVFYKNNHQLYYCRFNQLQKRWSIGELLTNLGEDHSHPYTFIDKKDNLHLLWCSIEHNNFILRHKKKDSITNIKLKWSNTRTLTNKNSSYVSPVLIQETDKLKIFCKQNNNIIVIISNDYGLTWSIEDDTTIHRIADYSIINYISNSETDANYRIKNIYCKIDDNIQIAGIDIINAGNDHILVPEVQLNAILPIEEVLDTKINNVELHSDEINNVELHSDKITNVELNSNEIKNELQDEYDLLKMQLISIEKENEQLHILVSNFEKDINILEEKIVDFKKQMLVLQEKISDFTANNSAIKRFLNIFK